MVRYVRPLLLVALVTIITWFYLEGGNDYLRFKHVQAQLHSIQDLFEQHSWKVGLSFFGIVLLLTSLSIPGSIVLTVLSGAVFGVVPGTLMVCTATTLGASIAFLMARFFFKDFIARKFASQFALMNHKFAEEGLSYLFTLRLIPASPFVVINLVMGITSMPLSSFAWVTFVGMLPGTFIYVYAGRKFAELDSITGIMTWPIIISLIILSLLPYMWKNFRKSRFFKRTFLKEDTMAQGHHRNSFYTVSGVEFEGEDMAHFGKGPKGYSRPDNVIREEAAEILHDHHDIDASDIELLVEGGYIYLKGEVETRYMKRLAQESVENIMGVRDVVNQLSVRSIGLVKEEEKNAKPKMS